MSVHSADRVENRLGDCFLERIPESIYSELSRTLERRYRFINGPQRDGSLHLAEYFLGVRRRAADQLLAFVRQIIAHARAKRLLAASIPEGFAPANLGPFEHQGGFSFGYFDAAVTRQGLRIIEAQAFPTYHITAAFVSHFLRERLQLPGASVFVNAPGTDWQSFIRHVQTVTAGERSQGIALTDRNLAAQRTTFEFFATQRELDLPVDLVDARFIFEENDRLYYRMPWNGGSIRPLSRLYNRLLPLEAIEDDHYPRASSRLGFRYDREYADFAISNHPARSFEISKHLLPYVSNPLNPECHELIELADFYRRGEIGYDDFVWKHKWGAAGRSLYLLPTAEILGDLTRAGTLADYIAQRKVEYERFYTGDGQKKIVEFRLMTVQSEDALLVVPMARIGHVRTTEDGRSVHHIHFGENNRPGYGFCPTLILED